MFLLQCLIDGRINLVRISKCIKILCVSAIKNWIKMDFTFANAFGYSPPKAYDVLEELRYKKESEESSEV